MVPVPNPTMRAKLLDEVAVHHHRSVFCPEYEDCLDVAVSDGWTSWSCEHCPLAAWASRPLVARRIASGASDATPAEASSVAMP